MTLEHNFLEEVANNHVLWCRVLRLCMSPRMFITVSKESSNSMLVTYSCVDPVTDFLYKFSFTISGDRMVSSLDSISFTIYDEDENKAISTHNLYDVNINFSIDLEHSFDKISAGYSIEEFDNELIEFIEDYC